MKKKYFIIGFIVSIILIAIAIPFIKENNVYNRVKDSGDIYSCQEYLDEYPHGRHADDVRYIKIKRLQADEDHKNDMMSAITDYLDEYPNGKYAAEITVTCDSIWDEEINRYDRRDKSNESPEAVKYMTEMLQYMKKHRINTIGVDVTSNLQLKDYEEYDSNVRDRLEKTNDNAFSISSRMISLKSNFSQADISLLVEILSDGVQMSFDKMFTPGFIKVENSPSSDKPTIHFDYTIQSQEEQIDGFSFPHIWQYEEYGIVKNYLIGISVFFDAKCTIPGSTTSFEYSEKGEPGKNISNVDNIEDGYRKMTLISFGAFSNKMAKNLGLKEIYFQDEQ